MFHSGAIRSAASNAAAAFELLSQIERTLASGGAGEAADAQRNATLSALSNKFYGLVPHVQTIAITTPALLKRRTETLEALLNISVGRDVKLDADAAAARGMHRFDLACEQLGITLTPLPHYTSEFDS